MTTLREAAQQALEALNLCRDWPGAYDECSKAITALRAALEQPVQEPVARYSDIVSDGGMDPRNKFDHPPRREWRGLTEEEMHGLYRRAGLETYYPRDGVVQYEYERRLDAYARAIEAALKERNA